MSIRDFGNKSFLAVKGLKERVIEAEKRPYWKCTKCGLELTFEEVCQSGGHNCEEQDNG